MIRTHVESENLLEIGHDPERGELEVVFRHAPGLVYTYANVEPELYRDLVGAPSKGEFFAYHIRAHPERYPYTKRRNDAT